LNYYGTDKEWHSLFRESFSANLFTLHSFNEVITFHFNVSCFVLEAIQLIVSDTFRAISDSPPCPHAPLWDFLYLKTASSRYTMSGVSKSVLYEGHILKKGLAGRIKRKNVSMGRNRRLKVPLYYKKVVSAIIWVILMMSRAARTHLASHMRVTCLRPLHDV